MWVDVNETSLDTHAGRRDSQSGLTVTRTEAVQKYSRKVDQRRRLVSKGWQFVKLVSLPFDLLTVHFSMSLHTSVQTQCGSLT